MMNPTQIAKLSCTQCGGELNPDENQVFVTCPFCSSTVYIDKSQVVFHWYLRATLDENQAMAALARWMSGSSTIKDLDKKARVIEKKFQYFPLWFLRAKTERDSEKVFLQPAAATSVTELRNISLPAGDLQRYDPAIDSAAVLPSVPVEAARQWLMAENDTIKWEEMALVHVPIYIYKYVYQSKTYLAVVEAATGGVIANLFPAKAEAPYRAVGFLTGVFYLLLAALPLIGFSISQGTGTALSGAVIMLGLLAAPFLVALAVWVAAKI